jgi:succinyl-diaminopimelate desuccinylase
MKKVEKRVISKVEKLKNELISTTKGLVSIPTINPPGQNYEECVSFLSDTLKEAGLNVKIIRVPKTRLQELAPQGEGLPRPNLIAELPGKSKKALHFNGHYDVVPATDAWKVNPFKPIVKDGKIYGRGSSDMKGAIASMTIAAKAIIESEIDLDGLLQISAVPDEETDGLGGTNFIIEERKVKADYCIVGEPSGVNNVWNAHKGILWMQLVTVGKAAHGSTPWLGVNAFQKVVQVVNAINYELKPKLAKKISSYSTVPPEGRAATISVGGTVETGKAVNIVPDRCLMTIDRRLIPEETFEEAKNEIMNLLKELQRQDPELKFETKIVSQFNACLTPTNSPICTTTMDTIQDVTGTKPTTTMCIGGLDMRYFVEAGIPTVAYGPGDLRLAHTANEYVEVQELLAVAKVYALTAMKLLGTSD